jgi:flagellar basal-body rod protein FlgF
METLEAVAVSRMSAMSRQMDIIANNIANANTPGFKGERVRFEEYLQGEEGAARSYVLDAGTLRDLSVGGIELTGNPLDVAINGDGYFTVSTDAGNRFTRDGHFRLDDVGTVVTSEGYPLLDQSGSPIVLTGRGEVGITPQGMISENGVDIGQIGVVRFTDEQAMERVEGGLYTTAEDPAPVEEPTLVQGGLETSNVQPIVEMSQMIELLRSFQASQRLIQENHDLQRRAFEAIAGVTA